MTRSEFIEHIENVYARGVELIRRKNADYSADSDPFKNFRMADMVGVPPDRAILVRISDKLARVSNLIDKPAEVSDETIDDTILDMINYLAILHSYVSNNKKLYATGSMVTVCTARYVDSISTDKNI